MSRFSLILTIHILIFIAMLMQRNIPVKNFAGHANVLPIFVSHTESFNKLTDLKVDHSSDNDYEKTVFNQQISNGSSVFKLNDETTNNSRQSTEPNLVSTYVENSLHLPASESKTERSTIVAISETPILTTALPIPELRTNLDHVDEKKAYIGASGGGVIEIHQLGSGKAIYSMPDLSQQGDVRIGYQVEVGDYRDIQLAIVNDIISKIRIHYKTEIYWNSKEKARFVRLSMLPQDHAILEKFLRLEIFGKDKGKDYSFWDKSKF